MRSCQLSEIDLYCRGEHVLGGVTELAEHRPASRVSSATSSVSTLRRKCGVRRCSAKAACDSQAFHEHELVRVVDAMVVGVELQAARFGA